MDKLFGLFRQLWGVEEGSLPYKEAILKVTVDGVTFETYKRLYTGDEGKTRRAMELAKKGVKAFVIEDENYRVTFKRIDDFEIRIGE